MAAMATLMLLDGYPNANPHNPKGYRKTIEAAFLPYMRFIKSRDELTLLTEEIRTAHSDFLPTDGAIRKLCAKKYEAHVYAEDWERRASRPALTDQREKAPIDHDEDAFHARMGVARRKAQATAAEPQPITELPPASDALLATLQAAK